MKIIITDTGIYPGVVQTGDLVIHDTKKIKACTGCLACWDRTPGRCIHEDSMKNIGYFFSKADEVVIVSRCIYGSYSSFVQKIMERTLPYFLPDYEIRDGKMYHKKRYSNVMAFSAYFYGDDLSDEEKKLLEERMRRLVQKFGGKMKQIIFVRDALQIGGLS